MSFRTKVSAAVIGAATIAGIVTAAPAASAEEGCVRQGEGWICTSYPSSGGAIRLHIYPNSTVQGIDTERRNVHLDKSLGPGRWEGPLGGGVKETSILNRAGTAWRACTNVGSGRYHCTVWA